MSKIDEYLDSNAKRFEAELFELLRIPSVSADPQRAGDIRRTADWLLDHFSQMGLSVELIETAGHPLVLAETPQVPPSSPETQPPTVLVYGHYDVQPPEPLELWTTPPFEPVVREGHVFARGAADNKGQFMTHVNSVAAWLAVEGRLPVNIKLLIEGEEEIGSGHLEEFVRQNTRRLACDCVVVSDSCQLAPGRPAITCGLRGITYYDLKLTGPKRDLHSGSFGGSVTNPANALAKMLAALIDERGRVQVPGFYDDVVPLSDEERRQFAALPFDEKAYMDEIGVDALAGEEGYTTLQRRWARPTFDICGLSGGYQGEGVKTVLPSVASAKLSFRLVPDQDPDKITAGLRKILEEVCPAGIRMELIEHQGSPGMRVSLDSPYVKAAARAIEHGFDIAPVYIREGGSIPVVATFAQELGADVLLLGWAQDDDNAHSPNEKFSLDSFHRATRASAKLWEELGRAG